MISTLKDAVRKILETSPIPPRQLAEEMGISYSYLMNAGNPDLADFKLAARVLIPLTRLTGNFAAIDFIEHALGRTALTLPNNTNHTLKDMQSDLLNAVAAFGALATDATDALADNKITAAEAGQLERDGYQLVTKVLEFLQTIEDCRQRGGNVRV